MKLEDRYKFRTPSLRNVGLDRSWGHSGAYDDLEEVVRHHPRPGEAIESYSPDEMKLQKLDLVAELNAKGSQLSHQLLKPDRLEGFFMRDFWVQRQPRLRLQIAAANELAPLTLSDSEVSDLTAFLGALTDPGTNRMAGLIPKKVPSGLVVED